MGRAEVISEMGIWGGGKNKWCKQIF